MDAFEMVVAIVAIALTAGVLKTYLKSRAAGGSTLSEEQERRLQRLEDRVRVLEAVVTDRGYDVKEKFRDLEG